jgi:phosphatidylserine/phosphatidylglycerophosphate/cardiolipin synthase-like enzyme
MRALVVIASLLLACRSAPPPDPVGLAILPEAGLRPLLRSIESAARSLDLEVYLLSHPRIIAALRDARARGVRTRVLLEPHPFGGAENGAAFAELTRVGVEVRWTGPAFALTHAKTLVVDRRAAWVMTANLTRAAFESNREYLAAVERPEQVAELVELFEADWARTAAAPAAGLVVSPENARARIGELIEGATASLDLEAEELTDPGALRQLGRAAGRGVAVRVVISAGADDAARAALRPAGGRVRALARPYVHAKMILADNRRLYVGSINLSTQSLDRNREVGVLLTAAPAAELAGATFERDWRAAQ